VYDEDLANLEESLRRLKIEHHVFFNGNRKKPPDDLRIRVDRLIKRLSECSDMSSSQRFRFATMVTRYYVYRDLWRRKLQEREMGMGPENQLPSGSGSASEAPGPSAAAIRISISDPTIEEEKVRLLYQELLRLRQTSSQESPLSYQKFAEYVTTRTLDIRKKYGCSTVAFTLSLEKNAIRFKASAENR
jgi:hypothetical protein